MLIFDAAETMASRCFLSAGSASVGFEKVALLYASANRPFISMRPRSIRRSALNFSGGSSTHSASKRRSFAGNSSIFSLAKATSPAGNAGIGPTRILARRTSTASTASFSRILAARAICCRFASLSAASRREARIPKKRATPVAPKVATADMPFQKSCHHSASVIRGTLLLLHSSSALRAASAAFEFLGHLRAHRRVRHDADAGLDVVEHVLGIVRAGNRAGDRRVRD